MNPEQALKNLNVHPDSHFDQHFLFDKQILSFIVESAEVNPNDIVLEIGPGTGSLTHLLAKKAKKVIAIEVDKQFKPALENLPGNVEIIFGDAREYLLKDKKGKVHKSNKLVSNLPYELGEPIMHYFNFARHLEKIILLIPKSFSNKIKNNPIFSAFFSIKSLKEVDRNKFYPIPKTDSEIISIIYKPLYEEDKNEDTYIRRKLYMQEEKKLKNGLLDIIISLSKLKGDILTKRKTKEIINSFKIDKVLLNKKIFDVPMEEYNTLADKIIKIFEKPIK